MKTPDRLRGEIEATEQRAQMIAERMAALLMRPTDERAGLGALLTEFEALRGMVGQTLVHLRRSVPRATPAAASAGATLAGFARAARTRHQLWHEVSRAVADCEAGHIWPLLPGPRPKFDLLALQGEVLGKVLTDAHRAVNPATQSPDAADLGCFHDIALDAGLFVLNLHLAARMLLARKGPRPWSFLDVGCGGGMKVALAAEYFDDADGLDYDPAYVEIAGRNLGAMNARCRAFQADGITFDGYATYDAIYFYQPMRVEDGLLALERQVVSHAAEGAILVAPYRGFLERAAELGCRGVAGHVYVKGLTDEALEDWVAETGRMGPQIALADRAVPKGADWLVPLWRACAANGIWPGQ